MGSLSRFLQNTVLDVLAGRTSSFATSGQVWAQLHHGGSPGVDGDDNLAGVVRQQITWGSVSGMQVVSSSDLIFANFAYVESDSPWISLWDAETNGNFIGADQATPPRAIQVGEDWKIPSGQLRLSLASSLSAALAGRILNMAIGSAALTGSSAAPYLQAHKGDPGVDGNNNIADVVDYNTGASGRMQTRSWPNPAANGSISSSTTPQDFGWQYRGIASTQLGITTLWDAPTGGNFLGKRGTLLSTPFFPGDVMNYSMSSFIIATRLMLGGSF